jgi:hypothetical protein
MEPNVPKPKKGPKRETPNEKNSKGSRVPDRPVNETKPPRTGMESV